MNALARPKKAPGELASKAERKPIEAAQYTALALLTNLFGAVFWFFEQRRSRLADRIETHQELRRWNRALLNKDIEG